MYRSLMVALDGSAFAEHALPLALGVARLAGASLHAVLVHPPYAFLDPETMSAYALEADARREGRKSAYLQDVAARLSAVSPTPVTATLLEELDVAHALIAHAAARGADLIVMTTHGRGPLMRAWLGSVTDEFVRRSATPVLVVRPTGGAVDLTRLPEVRRILVPLDGSPFAERVLEPALALGSLTGAEYTLLRVVPPGAEGPRAEAEAYLNGMAGRLRGQGARVEVKVRPGRQPAVAILEEETAGGADVIALATHGRRGAARLLLGSVADKVLRGATVPVLLYRPPGSAGKRGRGSISTD